MKIYDIVTINSGACKSDIKEVFGVTRIENLESFSHLSNSIPCHIYLQLMT